MAAILDRQLVIRILRVGRLEGLPNVTASIEGDIGDVHAVTHVDPYTLAAHRCARITNRFRVENDALRDEFRPGLEKSLILRAAVHRPLVVVHGAAVAAHEVSAADIPQHGLPSDD